MIAPADAAETQVARREPPEHWSRIRHGRDLVGLAALTAGWLQYYFFDTMVQINSLPKVVVFVPLGVS